MTALYTDLVQDSYGRPIPAVEVLVLNSDGSTASLTTQGGTPTGNPTLTDSAGRFSFYAADGVYGAEFRYGGVTIREDDLIVGNPAQYIGPAGPAANGRVNLAALKAAATTDLFSTYDGALWSWTTGDFTGKADDLNIVKANSTALTSGAWVRQTAAKVAMTPSGTGALTRTAAQVMDEFVFASNFSGFTEAGEGTSSDSYAAIMAAITAANARNRTLVIAGRPRILQTIKLTAPTRIRFDGSHFVPGQLNGGSLLVKAAACSGPAIQINPAALGSVIEGGGILGEVGNTGDGLVILGNSVTVRDFSIQDVGRDSARVGGVPSGDPWYDGSINSAINANGYHLELKIRSSGRDGLVLDDQKGGAIDANAGYARVLSSNNSRYGIYANKSYLGSLIASPILEANGSYGLYFDTASNGITVIGGDAEGNNGGGIGGNVYEAVARANRILYLNVQGVLWNNMARSGTWTPTVSGQTSAGAGTYTTRLGRYTVNGNIVTFWARIVWTAHTGTGPLIVNLPITVAPIWDTSTLGDALVEARLSGTSTVGIIKQATSTIALLAGDLSTQTALASTGTLLVSGSYEIVQTVAAL